MNGAPGSSAVVRVDHVGANNSYVLRPNSSALLGCMIRPIAAPIFGSNPYSIVHAGLSITPSSVMNSCTTIRPIVSSSSAAPDAPFVSSTNGDREIDSDRNAPLDRASPAVGARHAPPVSLKIWADPRAARSSRRVGRHASHSPMNVGLAWIQISLDGPGPLLV